MRRRTIMRAAGALAAATAATQAGATAFQLREGSATAIGAALAGRTASDRDVSFSLYNPASLRGVQGIELSSGVSFIYADGDATVGGPVNPLPPALGTFSLSDSPSENAIIPSFAAGWRLNEKFVLGVAVDSPFGLASEYDERFIGGFDAIRSELLTITVTPMVAWETTPEFTIGAGLSIQYADAQLENFNGAGVQDISGDGFDVGFTLGAIWEPLEGTQLGVAFTDGFGHTLEGEYSGNFVAPFAGASGEAAFDLPPTISVGLIQSVSDRLRVMGEVEWTGWSAFESIVITSPGLPTVTEPQNYEDSWFFSVGAEYDVTPALTVRGGVGYDTTPTRDAFRTARVPDGDRLWLAAGASYEITDRIGIDAGYLFLTIEESPVFLDRVPNNPNLRVDYDDGLAHLFTLNLRYAF